MTRTPTALPTLPLARIAPLALAGALGAVVLVGCGGGTEIAPSEPDVEGTGFASVSLDGVDLGSTRLVSSGVSDTLSLTTQVVGETVTFGGDDTAQLANGNISQGAVFRVAGLGGAPVYAEWDDVLLTGDYRIDRTTGLLTREATGAIPAGDTVEVRYTFLTDHYSVTMGIVIALGARIEVNVHNLLVGEMAPITITQTSSAPLGDGTKTFTVDAETEQTILVGRGRFITVDACSTDTDPANCPVMNAVDVTMLDATNALNPCIGGSLAATVQDLNDSDSTNRHVLLVDFDDPDC